MPMKKQSQAPANLSSKLLPYPVAAVPSVAPPNVVSNPKRSAVLDFSWVPIVTPSPGQYFLSAGQVQTALEEQIGSTAAYFVVKYIHAWALPDPTGAASLTIRDLATGVRSSGDGTTVNRARCGLTYPQNIQKVYSAPDSAAALVDFPPNTPNVSIDLRIGVTYWS